MGRRAGRKGGLFGSRFGVSAGVIVTQVKRSRWMFVSGPDGSIHMPPCRVVDAKGRRQEARDPCSGQAASRNPRQLPKPRLRIRSAQLAARQADRRKYRSTAVYMYNPAGGDYIMTGRAGTAYHRQAWVIEA